ncbi:MAG: hypothetical protein KIT56_03480 [Gammaproteobacteria bacterium]|nr:hypothetical protein [Gammaproteobacteria bacterium]MCW5582939.1 hypothetical protein [Gammaproteobacteria bacterium]
MKKSVGRKKSFSPAPIFLKKLLLSQELKEEIANIEAAYKFPKNFLPQMLNELVNWHDLEKDVDNQNIREADVKKSLTLIRKHSRIIIDELDNCGMGVRDRLTDTVNAIISGELLTVFPINTDLLNLTTPHIFEDILKLFSLVCDAALSNSKPDHGGNKRNTSMPKKIIFFLAEKYVLGTGNKPTNYYGGQFQNFLIEFNSVLMKISKKLSLGTDETIQKYAAEVLTFLSKTNSCASEFNLK